MKPGDKVVISGITREYREGIIRSWNAVLKSWNVRITLGTDKGNVLPFKEEYLFKIG